MNELMFFAYVTLVAGSVLAATAWSCCHALAVLVCLNAVLMNFFVVKEITLFGFSATAADALGIGAVLALNMIQEFYGATAARHAIWLSFAGAVYYVLLSLLHIAYAPGSYDVSQCHFVALLSPMPRIMVVSLASYLVCQLIDRYLYAKLAVAFDGRYFALRNLATIAFTQFLDTGFFTVGALWGIMPVLKDIILVSYTIKLVVILMATPFLLVAKKLVTRRSQ